MIPLAAGEDVFGNFFDGEVGKVGPPAKGHAEHQQAAVCAHFVRELGELVVAEVLGGDVDKVTLGRVALLPVEGVGGGVGKAL